MDKLNYMHKLANMEGDNPFSGRNYDFDDLSWFDIDDVNHVPSLSTCEVQFLNIKSETVVYKYQSRVRKEAKQRLKDAVVEIMVISSHQIEKINAWIQREAKAAELFDYNVGRVSFAQRDIIHKEQRSSIKDGQRVSENIYSIDLDSIYYDDQNSKRPVYKLAKTDMQNRNRFELIIQLVFVDHSVSKDFVSPAFYCCTQPKQGLKRKARASQDPYSTNLFDHSFDRLKVDEAVINSLKVMTCYSGPNKRDIAYHFALKKSLPENLEEGDIVGFLEEPGNDPTITKLTPDNFSQVFQTGVISRSAFLEGNLPPADKGFITDKICILGIVSVKVVGPVVAGKRIYASALFPGKAIGESHPMRVFENERLIGIALVSSANDENLSKEHLVKCFVSIYFGITSDYLNDKTRELQVQTRNLVKKTKKNMKCICWTFFGFLILTQILLLLGQFYLFSTTSK